MKEMMALSMKLLCLPFSVFVVTVVKITGNLSCMERGTHSSFPFRKFKIRKARMPIVFVKLQKPCNSYKTILCLCFYKYIFAVHMGCCVMSIRNKFSYLFLHIIRLSYTITMLSIIE